MLHFGAFPQRPSRLEIHLHEASTAPSVELPETPAATAVLVRGLSEVVRSVEVVQNLPALFTLLATFAASGLLLSMGERSLGRLEASPWSALQLIAAVLIAFYGSNAAGLQLMDDALGRPARDPATALRDALRCGHRLLLVVLLLLGVLAGMLVCLAALLWLCRPDVGGATAGPALFGLLVPAGVLGIGLTALSVVAVIVPLAAPGVWAGQSIRAVVGQLWGLVRRRLLTVALLMGLVSALAAAVGVVVSFVVVAGGKGFALLALLVTGIEVPSQQLMAGLFGYGLRSLGAVGAPVSSSAHGAAALVGGGIVFALALLLPGLVYLRGACAVYLTVRNPWVAATAAT